MPKVTPVLEEKQNGIEYLQEATSCNQSLLEESQIKQRNSILSCILSIRLFLIAMITLVVLLTSVSIWVTAYTMNEQAAMEQVNIVIDNMNEKIATFVNGQLIPAKYVADSMVNDYHRGYIDLTDSIREYLFDRISTFGVSVTNLCFGEGGYNTLFAYSVYADGSITYGTKRQNENLFVYKANRTTGEYYIDKPTINNMTYTIRNTDYYTESIALVDKYPNGAFGAPYKVLNGPQSTYWSTPVYNRTELPQKKNRIGFAKINISLAAIAQFLSNVKVMERGYVIISEYGNDYVIGSSLNIPGIDDRRIKMTNITTRSAGSIMSKLLNFQKVNSLNNTAKIVTSLMNENGESYLVASSPYIFHNLQWRMTLIFDETEIKKGIIQSSYVILGVSIGVSILGIIVSVVIGWSVTSPFFKLQTDFKNIEILDLVNVKPRSSIFSEANAIYSSLTETVRWLAEIRAFIPDSILNQLERTKFMKEGNPENKKDNSTFDPGMSYIASSQTLQRMRYFATLGPVMNRAKELNEIAQMLNVQVIVDQTTAQLTKDSVIFRPVERILEDSQRIQTVYQLLRKNTIRDDEWLYELEQKKANAEFDQFNSDFSKIFESVDNEFGNENGLDSVLSRLTEYSQSNPNDLVIKRLEQILSESKLKGESFFTKYHTQLAKQLVSYVRPGELIQSSMIYQRDGQ
ncbi:predicted protein [Naegleria gruberi]|uniref:Predicted protein n=1 Tax=Naegleria gruberi TaxID=5762 RepID=D2W3B9_NAEGR|nr:uncharacterized protein NAEGRDRAFT_75893 [Naegleria gruberi]EFC36463.1 predicted protein [Naegleria gruberi]|eukprot:XP_002669207.1 predicted protein [Naegleria gruberi strain NEG-M]